MEEEYYGAAYKGSRQFTQQQVKTANATGFGAAADDYMERGIDLNEQLILNKPATFFFRMKGDAMINAGMQENDILIVDRSIKAVSGKLVLVSLDGELLVRRYQQSFNKLILQPENPRYKPAEIGEFSQFSVWGVVTCIIHVTEPGLMAHYHQKKKDGSSRDKRST